VRVDRAVTLALVSAGLFAAGSCGSSGQADDPLAVVAAWDEARTSGDTDLAMGLLHEDARLFWYSMADPIEREAWLRVMDAQEASDWTLREECSARGEWVTCAYEQSDRILRRWGLALTGTHEYVVRDGKLFAADRRHDPESEDAVYGALRDFRDWVTEVHEELVPIIWSDPGAVAFTDRAGAEAALSVLDEYERHRVRTSVQP
jgi:hypothetical protein